MIVNERQYMAMADMILEDEAGFVDDPLDRGGATNLGVSLRVALEIGDSDWDGRLDFDLDGDGDVDVDDIRLITREVAIPFYRKRYFDNCGCPDLPVGVAYMIFDAAVNQGQPTARRFLQRAAGAVPDGIIGPKTMQRVARYQPQVLVAKIASLRMMHYSRCRGFERFGRGWFNRLGEVTVTAARGEIEFP